MSPISYPPDLPISARREEIVAALRAHQVVVVAGETGSGKTTQLPKMCLDAGLAVRGRIGCTQPRRVAALSVSRRVAEELGVTWGREVGCKMRFNDDTSRDTRIKFMTDGILLAEIQSDPMLRAYSALILDEAHERSLNIDFLLGYLQGLLRQRGDLKLIITSATIDTEAFSKAFGGAPIIEVSGRLWPVEIRYAPIESHARPEERADELSHIEAAVRATEDAMIESDTGDVLVFMPTERDIRDTREMLEGSLGAGFEVIGLFGRMPAAEQQRIFAPGPRRRVIVATNIAETSLTLPRIRYVIDAGLSRMSRYNPRTRTKRLPVEDISQSSANQRAGRAGRVQDGTCIRLYAEEDFAQRPRFTQPEIQRANLAEVILRMKAFGLGDIETFPFLNPPVTAAIRAGYTLLHELGALNDGNELTALGHELARLPIDPTLGRMLLQARHEKVLPEMLIIAAGLSVPDPRERPEDAREAAAAAHKAFADPDSDFLSLLNIWRAAPEAETRGGGNALRRFCKANFLSVSRMREWRDIYRQLADAVDEESPAKANKKPDAVNYPAIHRAILTGLLGQIALRQEKNTYKASGERIVTLFPGSNLYERRDKPKKGAAPGKPADKSRQPPWIVAGEIVETSMLFARMVAGINPEWVIELGAHLCTFRYTEPHWSAKAGRVLVLERVLVSGLEIARRNVDFGRIDPVKATELFIRGALVAEEARIPLHFFVENAKVRDKIETALTRVRSRRAHDLEESLYQFYAARIENVSSVHDLNRLVRERITRTPDFLCATEADLIGDDEATYDRTLFPDQVSLGNTALPVTYAYTPGHEADGVTVRVPLPVAAQLTTGQIQWMVPGLREEQIGVLLRALPKTVRKTLMPLEPKIREIAAEFQPERADFLTALADFLSRKYRVPVRAEDWPPQSLPAHLQPRVEVVDRGNKTVAAGRDLKAINLQVENHDVRSEGWERAVGQWEQRAITTWSMGDLPESVVVEEVGGAPLLAYPGLVLRENEVDVRLFRKREEAERSSGKGVRHLAELVLARDLSRLWKDLNGLAKHLPTSAPKQAAHFHSALHQISVQLQPAAAAFATPEVLQKSAYEHLLAHVLQLSPIFPLTEARFVALAESARRELPALTYQLGERVRQIFDLRQKMLASSKRYPAFDADLQRLLPADFLARTPHAQLPHLFRYLRAIQIRAERAEVSPAKDAEKAKQLLPFAKWENHVPEPQREAFRWMLEEFRVSLFAQELGTAQPASAQRLKVLGGF
ncbi:MAG: ATP-dependent RNA helicase HrpA [Chthoniobacter sp.]|uniref:ATP-dependent RNA helicase HrpA n=1 Tax=Chthoniobacter sp. TaxID=2510640 RepID=UPI0032A6BD97